MSATGTVTLVSRTSLGPIRVSGGLAPRLLNEFSEGGERRREVRVRMWYFWNSLRYKEIS